MVKSLPANAGDIRNASFTPGLGRFPGEENGNPLQYLCLENPRDRGSQWATVWSHKESDMTEVTQYQKLVKNHFQPILLVKLVKEPKFNDEAYKAPDQWEECQNILKSCFKTATVSLLDHTGHRAAWQAGLQSSRPNLPLNLRVHWHN